MGRLARGVAGLACSDGRMVSKPCANGNASRHDDYLDVLNVRFGLRCGLKSGTPEVQEVPKADIALCHSITSSARNRREVGIVGLIYESLRWGCARGDLVLRFGREIAGVMSFVQLFFKRPGGAVDHPPALDS